MFGLEKRKTNGQFDKGSQGHLSHGYAVKGKSLEYRRWAGMKSRCSNPNATDYAKYGGRGIRVSEAWARDFTQFLADMGLAPSPKHQIDRINVNGNYEASNCRWVDYKTQMNNLRKSVRIHLRDKSFTVEEICQRYELDRALLKGYVLRQRKKGLNVTYTEAFFFVCLKKGILP